VLLGYCIYYNLHSCYAAVMCGRFYSASRIKNLTAFIFLGHLCLNISPCYILCVWWYAKFVNPKYSKNELCLLSVNWHCTFVLNSNLFNWKQKCEPAGTESEANILAIWSPAENNIWFPKQSWGKFMNIFPTKDVDQVYSVPNNCQWQ